MRILLDENPCEIPAGTVGEAIAIAAEAPQIATAPEERNAKR